MATPVALSKEQRFLDVADAVAVVQSFAETNQQRRAHVQQPEQDSKPSNAVVVECENAPLCRWFVRVAFTKGEQKWKISSMNLSHSKLNCVEGKYTGNFQADMTTEQLLANASAAAASAASSGAAAAALGASVYVGMPFLTWKDAIAAVRALAKQMGRRAIAEKAGEMLWQDKSVMARRVVCQNYRNSNCGWTVVLDEAPPGSDRYTVLSMNLLHSKECLETCNFNARKREAAFAGALKSGASVSGVGVPSTGMRNDSLVRSSMLVDDASKYQLTHDMRWNTGKEATKAISDYALVVQRKRSMLSKKNNGGSNKKYVCSDEHCLWFVQLVKGWKCKNWKISAMNLKHSDTCTGVAKPTARQLAEMRFFRQAVITHSKSSGKLLTDSFLMHSESGIQIPRGMAYRAQRMVVSTSADDLAESYKYIPSLMDSFATKNPASIASYEKSPQGRFIRSFIMPYSSAILAAQQQIFGIHVLHYDIVCFHGCVVLLITRDGNLQYQVIAFALVPTGELEHMTWFLDKIKSGGVDFNGKPIFCAHSEHGLLRALASEARNAKIMFCVRSLLSEMERDKNIPALGMAVEELVWELQRQETEGTFAKVLGQIGDTNAAAAAFLRTVHPRNWAYYLNRSVKLYRWASAGADEALAGSDIKTSDEAPFDLIYTFLAFLMDGAFKKSQLAATISSSDSSGTQPQTILTPGADEVYQQEVQAAGNYVVRLCDEQVAFTWCKGERPKVTQRVDLSVPTCTCGQMSQLGLPCRHFIAVSIHFGNDAALLSSIDPIYKASTYAAAHHNMRIEIPTAEDLHKDESLHPSISIRVAKNKKRSRNNVPTSTPSITAEATPLSVEDALPLSKAARLDFDADVSSLADLV